MENLKDLLVGAIEERAWYRLGKLAGELIRTKSEKKELVLAEIDFQDWLAESCEICLFGS